MTMLFPGRLVLTWTLFLCILNYVNAATSWWDRHVESISCARPGYFVNPSDCRKFYRCVDKSSWKKSALQRYDFTCPSGMVFDPAFSVCTKPGSNGCAEPWWAGGGKDPGKNQRRPFGKLTESPGSESNERQSGENSLEQLPDIFNDRQKPKPGGIRPSDPDLGPFGGGAAGEPLDPLDADFGSLPGSPAQGAKLNDMGRNNSKPGFPDLFDHNSASADDDPLDSEFGSAPGNSGPSKSVPPFFGDRTNPGGKPSTEDPFGNEKGGDPLDAEFGSAPGNSGKSEPSRTFNEVPPFLRDRTNPGGKPSTEDPFGNEKSGDPLDAEFGSVPDGSGKSEPGRNFNEVPPFLRDWKDTEIKPSTEDPFGNEKVGDSLEADLGFPSSTTPAPSTNCIFRSSCNNNDRRKDQQGNRPGNNEPIGGGNWWKGNSNSPSRGDKTNNRPNNFDFDNWDDGFSPNNRNKNSGDVNWGRPPPSSDTALGESPWRPTGSPWGLDSSNQLGGKSPRPTPPQHSRPSWWDPPFAQSYIENEQGPPPPFTSSRSNPPIPWSYDYRPRYPDVQIVAYPTWQDNRSPIIIVYSNSKR